MADDHREKHGVTTAIENPIHRKIKRPRNSIESVDIISSLPDAILQYILSLIPTKLAIRTSVLSKRWKHVWCETPSLSINCYRSQPDAVIKALSRYTAPKLTSFHLSISTKAKQIETLIDFATSRNTDKLSIQFHRFYAVSYRFPEVFFTNRSLRQLVIESGTINVIPGNIVSWRSLKILSLRLCVVTGQACAKMLSGSPLLECLTLCCDKLQFLDLSKCLKLKRLDIEGRKEPMKIVAPHLRCLKLTHSDESQCDLANVSSLTEAQVEMYGPKRLGFLFDAFGDHETGLADSFQIMIIKTLEKLQNVEKLTLSGAFSLQILSLAVLCGVPFPTFKVEALTLETAIYQSVFPGVAKLIQNSPRLKTIKLDIADCNNIIKETCLANYLCWKGLDTRQCWKPKGLEDPSLSEPKLMTSVMTFLRKISGDDTVGSYTFSLNNNSIFCHGLNSREFLS